MGKSYSRKQNHKVVDYRNAKFSKKKLNKKQTKSKHVDEFEDNMYMNDFSSSFEN